MEHHLARCPACRSFAEELEGVTETLRGADLVEPPIRFDVPHRPARIGVSRAGTVAAASILVAVALGGVAGLGPDAPSTGDYLGNVPGEQEHVTLAEHFSLVLDRSKDARPAPPQGVAAAEQTTVQRVPTSFTSPSAAADGASRPKSGDTG